MEIETQCLYAGYSPKNGEPQTLPICQSTTFKYESTEQVSKLFDLEEAGFFYTRLGNPTVDAVEQKIATLEGGVGALCTASGQAATTFSILTLAAAGDHIVSSSAIYGGSLNLFAVTLKRLGIEVTFVSPEASEDEIQAAFRPNTKAVFGETIANPSIEVLDIEKFARIAHRNGVPLIVDNTFATPVLCRPIEFGADIVVHSTTKYMDGHALQMGGVIVDGERGCLVKFAKCCNPLPGDSIIGFVTKGFGISIHKLDCPNVIQGRKNPENDDRWKEAHWEREDGGADHGVYEALLQVYSDDRIGMLADITSALAEMRVSILQVGVVRRGDNTSIVNLKVGCKNIDHYNSIVSRLRGLNGVNNIIRGFS